jgi:hypothetical protein
MQALGAQAATLPTTEAPERMPPMQEPLGRDQAEMRALMVQPAVAAVTTLMLIPASMPRTAPRPRAVAAGMLQPTMIRPRLVKPGIRASMQRIRASMRRIQASMRRIRLPMAPCRS